ncbi:Hypothetical protein FKW44_001438, partial [Caligus rogercresseyi]
MLSPSNENFNKIELIITKLLLFIYAARSANRAIPTGLDSWIDKELLLLRNFNERGFIVNS